MIIILERHRVALIIIFLILLLTSCLLFLKNPLLAASVTYRGELDEIAHSFFSSGDLDSTLSELAQKEKDFSPQQGFDFYAFRAEMELFLGEIHEYLDHSEAEDHFASARDLAGRALEEKSTARAKRLKSESISRLFTYRGTFYIIRNSGRASRLLQESLAEEPDDEMTRLVEVLYLVSAPGIAGGDKQEARKVIAEIQTKGHPVYNYVTYNLLASLDQEAGNVKKAQEHLQKAEEIFPDSPLLGQLFD